MNRVVLASLACLALAGCPATNAPCLPEGFWEVSAWAPDPANSADCTPPAAATVRFDAEGELVEAGAPFMCVFTVAPVAAPMCTGAFNIGCAGSHAGTALFALVDDTLELEVLTTSSLGFCTFRATGNRVSP